MQSPSKITDRSSVYEFLLSSQAFLLCLQRQMSFSSNLLPFLSSSVVFVLLFLGWVGSLYLCLLLNLSKLNWLGTKLLFSVVNSAMFFEIILNYCIIVIFESLSYKAKLIMYKITFICCCESYFQSLSYKAKLNYFSLSI